MTLVRLRTQLALRRRQHAWRQRRLDIAHQRNDKARIAHWDKLLKASGIQIRALVKQIAAKTRQSPREKAVTYARSFAGVVRESPFGSNSGGLITVWERRLGFGPVPWCGCFVGNMLLHAGVRGVSSRIASVEAVEDDAKAKRGCFGRGWTTDVRHVLRGDVVVLFGRGVHQALVESVDLARGVIHTIEGNTSSGEGGNQSNGGMVARRTRSLSIVRGFACVNFPN